MPRRGAIFEGQHPLDAAFTREPRDRRRHAHRDRTAKPWAFIAGHDDDLCHDREAPSDEGSRDVLEEVKARPGAAKTQGQDHLVMRPASLALGGCA